MSELGFQVFGANSPLPLALLAEEGDASSDRPKVDVAVTPVFRADSGLASYPLGLAFGTRSLSVPIGGLGRGRHRQIASASASSFFCVFT